MNHKHSVDIKLILPDNISADLFMQLINGALENSDFAYTTYHWSGFGIEEIHKTKDYQLTPIHGNGLMVELEKKSD